MLISSYQERYARSTEKIRVLLNFLKEETYSDFQIIKLLFDFKSDRPLYRLLEKVEKMGLIQKHVHESRASRISLWGITADGLAVILTADDNIMPARFEPYRLTGWSLDHHLDNQLVRLTLEKNGATGWINGDRSTFLSQYSVKHRPDGLISLPDGRLIQGNSGNPSVNEFQKAALSDRDLKKEIQYTDGEESYNRVRQWLPAMFKYKGSDVQRYGLIAQDLARIDPEYVHLLPGYAIYDDVMGVDDEGNEVVVERKEIGYTDDVLSLDSNVLLMDLCSAFVYSSNKVLELENEIRELKEIVSKLINK